METRLEVRTRAGFFRLRAKLQGALKLRCSERAPGGSVSRRPVGACNAVARDGTNSGPLYGDGETKWRWQRTHVV